MKQILIALGLVCAVILSISISLLRSFPPAAAKVPAAANEAPKPVVVAPDPNRPTWFGLTGGEAHALGNDLLKSALTLALITFAGGMVNSMYSRRNAVKQAKQEMRKRLLNDLVDFEQNLRRSRLELRAHTMPPNPNASGGSHTIDWGIYESQLECIAETYHQVKGLQYRQRHLETHFRGIHRLLLSDLEIIAGYLDPLRDEYRDDAKLAKTAAGGVALDRLPDIAQFIGEDGDYERCIALLRRMRDLLEQYFFIKEKQVFSDGVRRTRREIDVLAMGYMQETRNLPGC